MIVELKQESAEIVESELKSGNFNTVSDIVHIALTLLEKKQEILDHELKLGLNSGISENFDFDDNLKKLHSQYSKNV